MIRITVRLLGNAGIVLMDRFPSMLCMAAIRSRGQHLELLSDFEVSQIYGAVLVKASAFVSGPEKMARMATKNRMESGLNSHRLIAAGYVKWIES